MMKFAKEDIFKAFRTSPMEESLLVFQSNQDASSYIEFALLVLGSQRITENDVKRWIEGIDRLKDCYIYEQSPPLRIRLKETIYPITQLDVPELSSTEDIITWLEAQAPAFDVQKPPLFHVYLLETQKGQVFCLMYHHLLFDGISVQLALSTLDPTTNLTFQDWMPHFAAPQTSLVDPLPFYLEKFVPPPASPQKKHLRESIHLPNTPYFNFMLDWLRFIKDATGVDDLIIGEVFSARDSSMPSQQSLGYYIQTWPLIFSGDITAENLGLVRRETLQRSSSKVNDYFTPNAFDHCWVVEPYINARFESHFVSKPHYVLTLSLQPQGEDLTVNFCWNLEKIDEEAAREITHSFLHRKDHIKPTVPHPAQLVHQNLIEAWDDVVHQFSHRMALEDYLGQLYTYKELDEAASRLAEKLEIRPGECVGVFCAYSAFIPISFLAILKRGGIYVPLDPSVAEERRKWIVENSGITTIISDITSTHTEKVIHPQQSSGEGNFKKVSVHPADTCYLIYTSGTTGIPKGCAVNHANVLHLFKGTAEMFRFSPEDHWILAHSYGFDFSTWEIWGALLNGAKLFIPDRKHVQDTFTFHQTLLDKSITILNQTPKSFYNLMLVDEPQKTLKGLRYVIFGGDKLHSLRLRTWFNNYPQTELINMYGITETTVHCTFHRVRPEAQSNIGIPLPGYQILLKNQQGNAVPSGFIGEIHVYGVGVCSGYYGNQTLTDEKFEGDAFGRYYKSGDLAWSIGENLYYLGRRDRQVKIRGYRIELGEIEFSLKQQVQGTDFLVLYAKEKLVAFYKGGKSLEPDFFRGKLADYSIPSHFIQVEAFPLNHSGKVDEKALIDLWHNAAPTNPSYEGFATLFQEVLGSNFDANRSFLQNGGDSILAIRLMSHLKKHGWKLNLQDLFGPQAMGKLKLEAITTDGIPKDFLKQFHSELGLSFQQELFFFPLLEAQEGILLDCLRTENPSLYVEQLSYEIQATYSAEALQEAYQKVCKHNPLLLAKISRRNSQYLFEVSAKTEGICRIVTDDLNAFLERDFQQGFDLFENLSRLTIIPGEKAHQVVWTHHHLLLDGWSLGIFSKKIMEALAHNKLNYDLRFISFCCENYLQNRGGSYWKNRNITSALAPAIPPLSTRNDAEEYERFSLFVPCQLTHEIAQRNISQHAFMLASWASFLGTLFSKHVIQLGNVVSLRNETSSDDLGMYIRTLPLALPFDAATTLADFVQTTYDTIQQDILHAREPLNAYLDANALQHLFVFENYPMDLSYLEAQGIRIGAFREQTGAAWTTIVYPKDGGFEFSILHDSRIYAKSYVRTIMHHFSNWMEHGTWDTPFSERKKYLTHYGEISGIQINDKAHHILDILKTPSKQAFILGSSPISYESFWQKAQELSDQLNISPGNAVGIDVSSSYHFALAIIAVWLAKGVVCPVDKRFPEARKAFIYKNAGVAKLLISRNEELEVVSLTIPPKIHAAEASFILHTSGSTGEPKGVVQTHQCLINLIRWNAQSFSLSEKEVILQLSSFGFDASLHEVLLAMALGAQLVEIPLEHRLDIQQIRACISTNKVTLAWIPARLLNSVLEADPTFFEVCTSIKHIVTTGEALVVGGELRSFVARRGVALLNFYGPTETHVVTSKTVNGSEITTQPSIGKVLPNTSILLMENNEAVPFGLPGEIWVSGDALALGYLNDPELTAAKFVQHQGKVFYKTGDFAYADEKSDFHFIGRKDDQLKIRGFRVEPLEVERMLTEIPEVQLACVLVHEAQLVAFLMSTAEVSLISRKAAELLPEFMMPSKIILLDQMPLNTNGKIDRKILKEKIGDHPKPAQGAAMNKELTSTKCWEEVLGHAQFTSMDRFEAVGGNSILLMKMQAWLEKNAGIYVAVKLLLSHNTPELLEKLLQQKSEEAPYLFPDNFPLSDLQKNILLTELANDWGQQSPFILSFTVTLKQPLEAEVWRNAVATVLNEFPYLAYGIDQFHTPNRSNWSKLAPHEVILANEFRFSYGRPLISLHRVNAHTFRFTYHHILLDGLGTTIFMNRIMRVLHQNASPIHYPASQITAFNPVQPKFRLKTLVRNVKAYSLSLPASQFKELENACQQKRQTISECLVCITAQSHHSSYVATADVLNHPGLPGMFTELKPLKINALGEITPLSEGDETMFDIVVNYMERNLPEDWVDAIVIQEPVLTKYPYEWQFIHTGRQIEVTFYTAAENTLSQGIFDRWKNNLLGWISGVEVSTSQSVDLTDDFDF